MATEEAPDEALLDSSDRLLVQGRPKISPIRISSSYSYSDELNLQAVVFLEDGIGYRSIYHAVDFVTLKQFRLYRSKVVQYFFNITIAAYLLLVLAEEPSSISATSVPIKYHPLISLSPNLSHVLEFIILCILTLDVCCELHFYKLNVRNPWLIAHVFIVVASFVELAVDTYVQQEYYIYRKTLRPFFLIRRSSLIKKMLKSLVRSIPQVFSVLVMLFLNLVIFSLFGMFLFNSNDNASRLHSNETREATEGNQYFPDLFTGMESLLVLLTTANNPTVLTPAYNQNRLYSLFFVLYMVLGLYCLMNMLTAVIYNQFSHFFSDSVRSSVARRRCAFRASFSCLQELQRFEDTSINNLNSDVCLNEVLVDKTKVLSVLRECRMDASKRELIIDQVESSAVLHYNYNQFKFLLITFLESPVEKITKPRIPPAGSYILRHLQDFLVSEKSTILSHVLNSVNALVIIGCAAFIEVSSEYSTFYDTIFACNLGFLALYIIHVVATIWAYGAKRYFSNWARLYQMSMTICIILIGLYASVEFLVNATGSRRRFVNGMKLFSVFIVLKFISFMAYIQSMNLVLTTLMDLITNLKSFAAIVFSAYYSFAILGMIFFFKDIPQQPVKVNSSAQFPVIQPPCGSYEQLDYWPNNFNDFFAACIVLWDIQVANNWNVFLDVYSRYSGRFSCLFFVAWWLIANVFLVNLLISLVIETFLLRLGLFREMVAQRTLEMSADQETTSSSSRHDTPGKRARKMRSRLDSSLDTTTKYNYSSIYDIFMHVRQMEEPTDEAIERMLKRHPEKRFLLDNQHVVDPSVDVDGVTCLPR